MILNNINSFMEPFIRLLWNGITWTWDTMQDITFMNTNLLEVMVTITILGIAIPILLSIAQNSTKVEKSRKVAKNDK